MFFYKYRRNSSSCQNTQCCRDCAGAPELWTQQLILILSFWSEVVSSPSHYREAPWCPGMSIPVSCTGPASPVMGIGALKLLGSSWRLGLNVEAEVVLAMGKAMMPWDHAEMVGCGLQTAKACGTRDLRGILQMPQLPAAVQTWPGLWCPLLHVSQQGSGGRCQLCASLAHWRRLGLSWATLESQASPLRVLGGAGSAVASTAQCLPLGGTTWCLCQRCGLCERVPCGSPKGRFNFSYEYCGVE